MSSTKVVTGRVRFSYANVFEAKVIGDSKEAKYSVSILIPKKDKATLKKIEDAVKAAAEAGKAKLGGKIPGNLKTPLRDGDEERGDDPAYAGHFFLNANGKQKPGVVDADKNPILDRDEFYSGCYGRASITFYAFNTNGNKGVACGLNHLMKLDDGEHLDGRTSADEDFSEEFDDEGMI